MTFVAIGALKVKTKTFSPCHTDPIKTSLRFSKSFILYLEMCFLSYLILVLLNPDISRFENIVNPDQLASGEAI